MNRQKQVRKSITVETKMEIIPKYESGTIVSKLKIENCETHNLYIIKGEMSNVFT